MRLLHYELLPYVSDKCIIGQWGELNTIIAKHTDNIMINYIRNYNPMELLNYTSLVYLQMHRRNISVYSTKIMIDYYAKYFPDEFCEYDCVDDIVADLLIKAVQIDNTNNFGDGLFPKEHTNLYLLQCYFTLQEKYNRGAEDLTDEIMNKIKEFVANRFKNVTLESVIEGCPKVVLSTTSRPM